MSAVAIPTVRPSITGGAVTPEDLLKIQGEGLYELVDGQLVEKQLSYAANLTAGNITAALHAYARKGAMGHVLPEQTFQIFPQKPDEVRRPDVAFINASRVPSVFPTGHVKIVPDLAVEVVSPNDNVYELDDKLADYQAAGVPLVWVVNPEARIIRVHRPGQPIDELRDGQVLSGQAVLPGFSASVTDLLPPPTARSDAPQATAAMM